MTVEILKPSTSGTYADTQGYDCRFAAEWLRNTGLFVGEQLDGQLCFQPEKTMSRGEFLTMLVRVLDVPVDNQAEYTGFADQCPSWLKPYLAAALRTGISSGWPYGKEFGPGEQISGAEAALLLQNALDLTVSADLVTGKDEDSDLPAWAQNAITTAVENGFDLSAAPLTRAQAALILYQVSKSLG